jgi:hypothetical protein
MLRLIRARWPDATLAACEIDPARVAYGQERLPEVAWRVGRCPEALESYPDQSVDVVLDCGGMDALPLAHHAAMWGHYARLCRVGVVRFSRAATHRPTDGLLRVEAVHPSRSSAHASYVVARYRVVR